MATYTKPDQNLTYNLPDEGTVFRGVGDTSTVYKIVNGELSRIGGEKNVATTQIRDTATGKIYNAGDALDFDLHNVAYTDPNFRGVGVNKTSAAQQYQGFDQLPEFNIADITQAMGLMKQYGQSYGNNAAPVDPTIQGYTNPNANFQNTGSTTGFNNNVPQTGTQTTIPGGQQTPEQAAATQQATGQTPATQTPQGQTATQTPPGALLPPNVQLQPGATGPQVDQLQQFLMSQGLLSPSDYQTGPGIYGPKTTAAVAALQQKLGIDNSSGPGYFGPRTLAGIQAGLANGTLKTQAANQASAGGGQLPSQQPQNSPAVNGNAAPTPTNFLTQYQDVIKSLGLTDIKSKVEAADKAFADVQNELNDKVSDINEDPWLSEGVRVRKIQQLQERYQGKLEIASNMQRVYSTLYEQGLSEAKYIATGLANEQQQIFQNAMALQEAQAKLTELDPSTFKEVQRGLFNLKTGQWIIPPQQNTGGGSSGLSPSQVNSTVNQIVGSFDNEQIVKDYNAASSQYQLMNTLGTQGKNPGDDIAYIYAFAKLMDPNSVVREGEYATVQKYAQSLLSKVELDAVRTVKNSNFLSPDAKQNLLNVAKSKIGILDTQYQNLYSEYQKRLQQAQTGGYNSLPNYSNAFGSPNASAKGSLTNAQFVEQTLSKAGIPYQQLLDDVPYGQIGVVDNKTGQVGYIPAEEFNSTAYTRI